MDCDDFRSKSVDERKGFVKKESLCWNCMSKSHVGKNDISKYSYRKKDCDKKHHTLLHEDKKANIHKSSRNKLQIQNAVTYLQVLPVIVTNRSNHVKTSSQLYTVSGSTLITLELEKQPNLKGTSQKSEISNVISTFKTILSKLVNFSVSSNHHSDKIKIENAWVI